MFNFTTDGATPSAKFIVYGDLGFKNAQSVPRITSEIATGTYSAVLHVGDFAYDMYDDEGRVGDSYFRMVEPFAANTAYLACPGNHENHADFAEYRARFAMPGGHDSIYSSFDIGPAHIIMWSTEVSMLQCCFRCSQLCHSLPLFRYAPTDSVLRMGQARA